MTEHTYTIHILDRHNHTCIDTLNHIEFTLTSSCLAWLPPLPLSELFPETWHVPWWHVASSQVWATHNVDPHCHVPTVDIATKKITFIWEHKKGICSIHRQMLQYDVNSHMKFLRWFAPVCELWSAGRGCSPGTRSSVSEQQSRPLPPHPHLVCSETKTVTKRYLKRMLVTWGCDVEKYRSVSFVFPTEKVWNKFKL